MLGPEFESYPVWFLSNLCTKPLITILPLAQLNWNTIEKAVKQYRSLHSCSNELNPTLSCPQGFKTIYESKKVYMCRLIWDITFSFSRSLVMERRRIVSEQTAYMCRLIWDITFSFSRNFKMDGSRIISEYPECTSRLILVFTIHFSRDFKMDDGIRLVSEQTTCTCRLIFVFPFSFSQDS